VYFSYHQLFALPLWISRGTRLFDSISRINHGPRDFLIAPWDRNPAPGALQRKDAQAGPNVGAAAGREGFP
jgi:hypothetical protein